MQDFIPTDPTANIGPVGHRPSNRALALMAAASLSVAAVGGFVMTAEAQTDPDPSRPAPALDREPDDFSLIDSVPGLAGIFGEEDAKVNWDNCPPCGMG